MPPITPEIPEEPVVLPSFNKEEVEAFVKKALEQTEEIAVAYKKLFEDESEDGVSLMEEIETKLESIKEEYSDLFVALPPTLSKVKELEKQIEEIKSFHTKLTEGDSSIEANIKESQDKITEFFVYLFGDADGSTGEVEKIKKSIQEISDFHTDLKKAGGYQPAILKAHTAIVATYQDLYEKKEQEGDETKVALLYKDIEEIKSFRGKVTNEISPHFTAVKDNMDQMSKDIKGLLGSATGGALVDGFLKSKKEYRQEPDYLKFKGEWDDFYLTVINPMRFIKNYSAIFFDYFLFIAPLIVSVFIFVDPEYALKIIGKYVETSNMVDFVASQNFYGRLIVNLPLWWISWFGQRSISQKRRLAEEYNHKAQVTTMYLNFSSRETAGAYPLSVKAREQLDIELIEAIKRHPGHVYGNDDSFLDKIIEMIKVSKGIIVDTASKASSVIKVADKPNNVEVAVKATA